MTTVEAAYTPVRSLTRRRAGDLINAAANQMPQRMAPKSIARQKYYIDRQNNRAKTNAEIFLARSWVCEPKPFPDVVREERDEADRNIKKVAMNILDD